ncbi:hypothetical protein SKAU_G00051120 [Synaphobranchus kaupii]|uniref:High mobility group 20B n=1 Tax=Synaphobranchus kaupii TaxID=118154 RepID=A0A9Q1G420_SYNKA|nr:hypothetical protein SKAU_G00051120 [Synaphobranchus kaupii]
MTLIAKKKALSIQELSRQLGLGMSQNTKQQQTEPPRSPAPNGGVFVMRGVKQEQSDAPLPRSAHPSDSAQEKNAVSLSVQPVKKASAGNWLRALPERATGADPRLAPRSALPRNHQEAGCGVEPPSHPHDKQRYLDEAERDKQHAKIQDKKVKREELTSVIINASSLGPAGYKGSDLSRFDVPIFTEEFLDQNKAREAELRRLRKANVEFEEQNSILQKHIADMYSAKERLEAELGQDERRTQALHRHLQAIKHMLVSNLATVALPGTGETPSLGTLDSYLSRMGSVLETNPQEHRGLVIQLQDILAHLDR